jgi:hypothetical protein
MSVHRDPLKIWLFHIGFYRLYFLRYGCFSHSKNFNAFGKLDLLLKFLGPKEYC